MKIYLKGIRKGAVAIEVAVFAVIAIPFCLAFADFLIYSAILSEASTSVQSMASEAQAKIPNGSNTSHDDVILAKGKGIIVLGGTHATTSVNREEDGSTTKITWTATVSSWSPHFTGFFPDSVSKSQSIWKN